jgi:hypothetical protein
MEDDEDTVEPLTPLKKLPKPLGAHGDTFIPSAFFSDPRDSRRRLQGLRQLDRFIPARKADEPGSEKLRTTAHPYSLTRTERMLRSNEVTQDPFGTRPRAHTAPIERARPELSRRAASPTPAPLGTALDGRHRNHRRSRDEPDWRSFLNPPGISAVDDGRGRFILSGTNARLFPTCFPSHRSKSDEEQLRHEHRLEYALGLDRARRMLQLKRPWPPPTLVPVQMQMQLPLGEKASWDGAGWARGQSPKSKRALFP